MVFSHLFYSLRNACWIPILLYSQGVPKTQCGDYHVSSGKQSCSCDVVIAMQSDWLQTAFHRLRALDDWRGVGGELVAFNKIDPYDDWSKTFSDYFKIERFSSASGKVKLVMSNFWPMPNCIWTTISRANITDTYRSRHHTTRLAVFACSIQHAVHPPRCNPTPTKLHVRSIYQNKELIFTEPYYSHLMSHVWITASPPRSISLISYSSSGFELNDRDWTCANKNHRRMLRMVHESTRLSSVISF